MRGYDKRCADYALEKISTGSERDEGVWFYFVERDGRRIFSSQDAAKAAMFAEELFERVRTARLHVSETEL